MTLNRWIAIWTAFAVLLAFPALSVADHHKADEEAAEHRSEKAGGKAAEHRSEMAAEKSNAQWDEDNEGRPEKSRRGDDEDGDDDGKHKKENKHEKKQKEKKNKGQKPKH
jgi:hypothetical protein